MLETTNVLTKVKLRLDIESTDESKDNLLTDYINECIQIVLNYCHIDAVPDEYVGLIKKMVIDYYKHEHEEGNVKSITDGDTSTSYVTIDKMFINKYKKEFPPRVLRW